MIRKITFLFCVLSIILITDVKGQDIHFTSYDYSPLTLNPALAGGFLGSYRLGGIYRDQWRSASSRGAYSTPTIHVDLPVIQGFRKRDWIGIGAGIYSDRSSQYTLVQTKSFQGVSYHLALDKKQNRVLSIGVQNGTGSRSVNRRSLETETRLRSLQQDPASMGGLEDDALLDSDSGTIVDWVGGLVFSSYQRNQSFIRGGVSVGRITRPSQSFANGQDRQRVKLTVFGLYDFPISGNLFLTPSIMYQGIGNNYNIVAQTKASYLVSEKDNIFVNAGLGYRYNDAIQLLMGMDYKSYKFQFAYDMNVSGLRAATNTVGAFELGISYIGKVYKKPKIDRTEVCPRI